MSVKFSDSVKYIGVDDTTIDLFESQYVVPKGVSYNSYVILDDKVALMDTVDKRGNGAVGEELDCSVRRSCRRLFDHTAFGAGSCRKHCAFGRIIDRSNFSWKCENVPDASTVFDLPLEGHTLTVKRR